MKKTFFINEKRPHDSAKKHVSGLADYIDVFCEKGYFSVEDMERIVNYGKRYGLIPKVHVNQFNINFAFFLS